MNVLFDPPFLPRLLSSFYTRTNGANSLYLHPPPPPRTMKGIFLESLKGPSHSLEFKVNEGFQNPTTFAMSGGRGSEIKASLTPSGYKTCKGLSDLAFLVTQGIQLLDYLPHLDHHLFCFNLLLIPEINLSEKNCNKTFTSEKRRRSLIFD